MRGGTSRSPILPPVQTIRRYRLAAWSRLEAAGRKVHNNQDIAGPRAMPPAPRRATMTDEEERELRAELARLQQEHRDLDAAIAALQESPGADILQVQRLKKRKLQLRDRINAIEDQLTPDIIA
jgi:hypothetical protein